MKVPSVVEKDGGAKGEDRDDPVPNHPRRVGVAKADVALAQIALQCRLLNVIHQHSESLPHRQLRQQVTIGL